MLVFCRWLEKNHGSLEWSWVVVGRMSRHHGLAPTSYCRTLLSSAFDVSFGVSWYCVWWFGLRLEASSIRLGPKKCQGNHFCNSCNPCISSSSSTLSPSSSPTPFHRPPPKSWQSAALENIFFFMANAPGRIHQKSNRFPSTASFEWAPYRNRVGTIKKNIHSSTIEAVTNQQC